MDFLPESAVRAAHPLHREHVPRFMLILRRRPGNCTASQCHESSGAQVACGIGDDVFDMHVWKDVLWARQSYMAIREGAPGLIDVAPHL
jgi:hypothetical protein